MKQYTRSIDRFSLGILLLSMTVVGCANSSRPEMGQSVTKIMNRQVANPNVAMQKHETTGTGLDAAQGEAVLKTLRADVAQPKSISKKIDINIGN